MIKHILNSNSIKRSVLFVICMLTNLVTTSSVLTAEVMCIRLQPKMFQNSSMESAIHFISQWNGWLVYFMMDSLKVNVKHVYIFD